MIFLAHLFCCFDVVLCLVCCCCNDASLPASSSSSSSSRSFTSTPATDVPTGGSFKSVGTRGKRRTRSNKNEIALLAKPADHQQARGEYRIYTSKRLEHCSSRRVTYFTHHPRLGDDPSLAFNVFVGLLCPCPFLSLTNTSSS